MNFVMKYIVDATIHSVKCITTYVCVKLDEFSINLCNRFWNRCLSSTYFPFFPTDVHGVAFFREMQKRIEESNVYKKVIIMHTRKQEKESKKLLEFC